MGSRALTAADQPGDGPPSPRRPHLQPFQHLVDEELDAVLAQRLVLHELAQVRAHERHDQVTAGWGRLRPPSTSPLPHLRMSWGQGLCQARGWGPSAHRQGREGLRAWRESRTLGSERYRTGEVEGDGATDISSWPVQVLDLRKVRRREPVLPALPGPGPWLLADSSVSPGDAAQAATGQAPRCSTPPLPSRKDQQLQLWPRTQCQGPGARTCQLTHARAQGSHLPHWRQPGAHGGGERRPRSHLAMPGLWVPGKGTVA